MVTIMFSAPSIEEAPAKCILKIAISTEALFENLIKLNGGYNVQPVPAPSINIELISKNKDQGKNQKLKLFNLGKAISGAPIITGTIQLPKPPIKIGITKKNIIISA